MSTSKKWNKLCQVVDADYLGGHKLRLKFNDGLQGVFDFTDYVKKGVFRPLMDPKKFTQFGLMYGTIVWKPRAGGMELDIAPEYLYQRVFDGLKTKQKKHGFNYFSAESWPQS